MTTFYRILASRDLTIVLVAAIALVLMLGF